MRFAIAIAYVGLCVAAWPLSPLRYFTVLAAYMTVLFAAKRLGAMQPEGHSDD